MCWAFFPAARMMEDCGTPWVADHIDNDKTNDVLLNLQVLTLNDNNSNVCEMSNHNISTTDINKLEPLPCYIQ